MIELPVETYVIAYEKPTRKQEKTCHSMARMT
jgi:hypothetical protein